MNRSKHVAVIGGGVSGISSAHYLLNEGYTVDLYERENSIGGRVGTRRLGKRMVAMGGKNIGGGAKRFRDFVTHYGDIKFEDFGMHWSRVVNGKLIPLLPKNPLKRLYALTKSSDVRDLIKFNRYRNLVKKGGGANDFLGNAAFSELSDSLDHSPLSDHFGTSFNENIMRLMTVRMFGAEPESCYVANLNAALGMANLSGTALEQLEGDGMHDLLESFQRREKLNVFVNSSVCSIYPREEGVIIEDTGSNATKHYDGVVIAATARVAASLLSTVDPLLGEELLKVAYNPVALAVVKYSIPVFGNRIKSVSFSKEHVLHNAGVYGLKDLDTVRYTFSGKAASAMLSPGVNAEELIIEAENLLNQYCPVSIGNRLDYAYEYYHEGLCSLAPYHHKIIARLQSGLKSLAVEVAGDYIAGPAIEACFYSSEQAVDRLHRKLVSNR